MDANKAVELGFADEIMKRAGTDSGVEDLDVPQVSMMFSEAVVTNSLKDKLAAKCRIERPAAEPGTGAAGAAEGTVGEGRSVEELAGRLEMIKYHI